MEDVILRTTLGDSSHLYISPIDRQTYEEHVGEDNLGGDSGYFILRSRANGHPNLEVLAKAPTFEAASALFDLIVSACRAVDDGVSWRKDYSTPLFL